MWTAEVLRFVCAIFLFGGCVTGVASLGLSAVALKLLAATVGLRETIALMRVLAMVAKVWQVLATRGCPPRHRVGILG